MQANGLYVVLAWPV